MSMILDNQRHLHRHVCQRLKSQVPQRKSRPVTSTLALEVGREGIASVVERGGVKEDKSCSPNGLMYAL